MAEIWSFPTRIVFGAECSRQVGAEAQRLGLNNVLVVTDPGVVAAGLIPAIVASLEESQVAVEVYADISSNPSEREVNAGADAYRKVSAQGVISIGGGAAMDVGKLIAVRVSTTHSFEELDDALGGDRFIPSVLPPTIAVPTTAGTGSEVGRAGVLTVDSTGTKTVVFAPAMLPSAALLDPALTASLPPLATAATGFDALSHCIEAYLAKGDHPMADAIALSGMSLASKHLVCAVEEGGNLEARGALMKAATMGAVAFQKGLGACHSLSHPLSAELGTHHGLANAICLPSVVDFNEQVVPERVSRVDRALGGNGEQGGCGRTLRALRSKLGLPEGLASQGIAPEQLSRLAALAMADGCHGQNPRACSEEDFLRLYSECL